MNEIFKFLKNNALVLITISVMIGLGVSINALMDSFGGWDYITAFFTLFRHLLASIDWIWPIDALLAQIAIILSLKIILWGLEGVMFVINKVNKYE